jgi:hypothetical protein
MSAGNVDTLMDLWAASLLQHNDNPPFTNVKDLRDAIDAIDLGHVSWESFTIKYSGELPQTTTVPEWMKTSYEVWYRDPLEVVHNMLSNPDFNDQFNYSPFQEFEDDKRKWSNLMSGNWAWTQAASCFICLLVFLANAHYYLGSDCERPEYSWVNVCPYYSWER